MEKGVVISESEMMRKIKIETQSLLVDNYSVRKLEVGVGQKIESAGLEEFVLGGLRWGISLYPEGVDDDSHNKGYASLYVTLKSAGAVDVLISVVIAHPFFELGITSICPTKVHRLTCSQKVGRSCSMLRSKIDSRYYGDVLKDSLKLCVSVGVFTYHQRLQQEEESKCWTSFYSLLDGDDEFIFFHVGAEGETHCAAKSIIAARCPLLLSHLPDVVIPDVCPLIFSTALFFIYHGTLGKMNYTDIDNSDPHDLESFAAKLLGAADRFQIQQLKQICENRISKKVRRETVASLLNLADICNAAQLKSACLRSAFAKKGVLFNTYDKVISSFLRWAIAA